MYLYSPAARLRCSCRGIIFTAAVRLRRTRAPKDGETEAERGRHRRHRNLRAERESDRLLVWLDATASWPSRSRTGPRRDPA